MTWQNRIIRSENVDPTSLTPNPKNWRKHPKFQVEAMNGVLDDVGWIQDVIVNERTGNLIDGHLRLELARKNKESTIPVKYIDLTVEEEEKALATFDPIGAMAEADATMLNALIERCQTDNEEVKGLLVDIAEKEKLDFGKKEAKEDDFEPPAEVETDIKRGDIIKLGRHRVMCGDSTSMDDVERLMDGVTADMIFTDPPYNVDYGSSKNPRHKIPSIENDSMPTENWSTFCHKLFEIFKVYNKGDIYMWGASSPEGMRMRLWLTELGCHWSATIIWKKNQLVLTPANYQRMYEPCFYGWFGKSSYNGDRTQTEVWDIDRPRDSKLHPTMKPINLCQKGIENSSIPKSTVLDLFLGSGSTLIACEQLDRTCYGMEISPQYCEVICQRWEKLTGGVRKMIDS